MTGVKKMDETKLEIYRCECGNGTIELTKLVYSQLRSSKKRETYASITPCTVCGSTIDLSGRDLSKLL